MMANMFSCEVTSTNCDQSELLKKLQLENEKLEEDSKAPPPSSLKKFHSRQGSTSSLLSINSVASCGSSLHQHCSQDASPSFPMTLFQEHSLSSTKGLKSKSNASSLSTLSESWDIWLALISEWELVLKQGHGSQKLLKLHQKASDLFKQAWCIPDALRGLVWQLVSGARHENAACVILNPSAAVTGSSCLGPSSLLSTEHLSCFPDGVSKEESVVHKGGSNDAKATFTITSGCANVEIYVQDNNDSEIITREPTSYHTNVQPEDQQNENPLTCQDQKSTDKEMTKDSSYNPHSSHSASSFPVRYADLLLVPSPHEKTISRDISRTYPNHSKFKDPWGEGQESLFNVARAYSVYDKEVGYCQGSSFIVGLLLMHMPEEDAFGVLVRIMYAYNLRDLFKPSMEALGLKMFQLDRLIQDNLPDLHSTFSSLGIQTSMFASPWFLTLFATSLPLPLVCQVFDAFLCQGSEVIFLLGLSLLKINQNTLLRLSMEELVQFLQKDLGVKAEAESSLFFSTAFQFKVNSRRMKKLEKEYAEIEIQERIQQTEICQLRSENRRLQMLVEKLEKETGTLADQLMAKQVECSELRDETSALRHVVASARKLLVEHDVLTQNIPMDMTEGSNECNGKRYLDDLIPNLALAEVESLREELIGCKLREAESNLSIKKLQHEIHEIEKLWDKMHPNILSIPPSNKNNLIDCAPSNQKLLTCHIREADLLSELADARLNLTSLEHKVSCLEKRNNQLEKQLANNNLEIGSLIRDNKILSELMMENEKNQENLLQAKKEHSTDEAS